MHVVIFRLSWFVRRTTSTIFSLLIYCRFVCAISYLNPRKKLKLVKQRFFFSFVQMKLFDTKWKWMRLGALEKDFSDQNKWIKLKCGLLLENGLYFDMI